MTIFVIFSIYTITLILTNHFQRRADSEDDFRSESQSAIAGPLTTTLLGTVTRSHHAKLYIFVKKKNSKRKKVKNKFKIT